LIQRNNFLLTELNVHRVVITAILLAAKFFDDAYYNNAYYSKVGGVLVSEMNGLEVDFLFRINFSLHVTPEVFEKYKAELVAHSINSGLSNPPGPMQAPHMVATNMTTVSLDPSAPQQQNILLAPIPTQSAPTHHLPMQVTPSPSHAANLSAPLAAPAMDQQNEVQYPMYVGVDQVFPNGITQQMLQRANSLPPPNKGHCVLQTNPPYSAPMVSMVPVGVENQQYMMVNNQIFPLETTLVHHHHGVENYHEQTGFHHQQHGGTGYPLTRDSLGSLVAGHY
jgi:hypothetical protein